MILVDHAFSTSYCMANIMAVWDFVFLILAYSYFLIYPGKYSESRKVSSVVNWWGKFNSKSWCLWKYLKTYERAFIQKWIDAGNKTCPKTQQVLSHLILTPNYVLKSLIAHWCETHGIELPKKVWIKGDETMRLNLLFLFCIALLPYDF